MSDYKKEAEFCMGEEEVVGCVTKMIQRHQKDACSPKFVLLTQPNCEPCKKAQDEFSKDIETGLIQKISFDSTLGMEIIEENNISVIPTLILIDCHGKIIV